ncbi:tRNA1(Val) (adenine(37)-N6)-methyltransferase [Bacillus alkalicellulosilyticus]|uniref:tRNA1(Val) (adenine(37)-N6)-methyltransferase n=1 Tax=Alkalihalobacterium alkalicellulosilyticum TaxID=1912214 RepID=UPI000997E4F1|nr:tRNA1(Val) (adenine(37)-N6)-methyltransferase [Bacillus alkalicellulosilyticus]
MQRADERIDYLPNNNLKIIQSTNVFSFSIDAVLLAKFVYVPIQKGRILDMCSGNGVIPLLLSTRSKASIVGVEIQETLYDMAVRSIQLNRLEKQIEMVCADIKQIPEAFTDQQYDVVTCNPPYFECNDLSDQNENEHFRIARHEVYCTLEDVVREASELVKQKGKFAIVHRPERLTDIMLLMKKYRIEPKKIQMVHPKADKDANIVLVEGIKDGKKGVKCLPPIVVYGSGQSYTDEFKSIYGLI